MVYTLRFLSSKCSLFHNSNVFGSCIIHILYTGRAKIKKINSGARSLNTLIRLLCFTSARSQFQSLLGLSLCVKVPKILLCLCLVYHSVFVDHLNVC